jgi:hypothetical protein
LIRPASAAPRRSRFPTWPPFRRRSGQRDVAAVDALLRPFAPYDRIRFGGPVSRDRYVSAVRERFSRR